MHIGVLRAVSLLAGVIGLSSTDEEELFVLPLSSAWPKAAKGG